jgi:hypothetical protein
MVGKVNMTKNLKTVKVGHIEVMRITTAEHRAIDRKIKKRYARLRKRYKEIRGKKVDWIEHTYEEGSLYVGVRFMDGTYFSLDFSPQIVTDGIEFSDVSSGDEKILKVYYRRRD